MPQLICEKKRKSVWNFRTFTIQQWCILVYYIHVFGVFKDPLAGEYKFSAPQLVMKVKSPPQITGEKIGTMGNTHYIIIQCGQGDASQRGLKGDIFKDPLAGEYKFSAPQLVMKVKSPPQITGEKIGTMGNTHYIIIQCGQGDASQRGLKGDILRTHWLVNTSSVPHSW